MIEYKKNRNSAAPCLLAPDNFTSSQRTPWGGTRIRFLKGMPAGPRVGESWELSVEPSHPSRTADGRELAEVLDTAPGWLGSSNGCSLLVKLLDADQARRHAQVGRRRNEHDSAAH